MKTFLAASLASLVVLVPGCASKECTLIGCDQSVKIDFSFREQGAYVFEVTVDGVKTTCKTTLPLPQDNSEPCDRRDVLLRRNGSALPPDQQSLDGLILPTTTAKTVVVRATRDGAVIGDKTIELTYTVTPGPNGPDCDPKECRSARATFP